MECYNFQYAVKFMCGKLDRDPQPESYFKEAVAPGDYFTAINIHNPTDSDIVFRYKVAIAFSPNPPRPPISVSKFSYPRLGPDEALEIDCPEITDIIRKIPFDPPLELKFAKGFVVIESDVELDVVAVYTAAGGRERQVVSMHMERVAARRPIRLPHHRPLPDQS